MTNEAEFDASFYEAIGRALTAWSGTEACLTSLFQTCFDAVLANGSSSSRSGFSGRVLDAVDGVSIRIKMVHEALTGTLKNSDLDDGDDSKIAAGLLDTWEELKKSVLNDLIPRRNKLAHWSVYVAWDGELNCRKPILVPHENSLKRHEMLRDEVHTYDEAYVRECRGLFEDARKNLQSLAVSIAENHFGLASQLDNMRAASHYWGAEVDDLCNYLRKPYAPRK